jgi:uncharacterized Zn finger protein
VEGGLKARSRRGAIAQTWWSERFIGALESYGMGGRLSRGRNYARRGQVLDIEINPGAVAAKVQGSRRRPYSVRLAIRPFGKADWARVGQALADDAWYAAKLLGGEMPEDIEDLFTSLDLPLFPETSRELAMDCTCPDWEVPCKHIAAVSYLLAEQFDEDPFKILAWRGRDRQELLDSLAALRTGGVRADREGSDDSGPPLAESLAEFFAMRAPLPHLTATPGPPDALLDQLPTLDISIRSVPLVEALRPAYRALGPGGDAE